MTADAIKRYSRTFDLRLGPMQRSDDGEYVRYADIAPTLAEVAALREALNDALGWAAFLRPGDTYGETHWITRARALLTCAAGEGNG